MFDFSNCVRETARSNPEHFCKYTLLRIQIMMISNSNNSKNEYTIEQTKTWVCQNEINKVELSFKGQKPQHTLSSLSAKILGVLFSPNKDKPK